MTVIYRTYRTYFGQISDTKGSTNLPPALKNGGNERVERIMVSSLQGGKRMKYIEVEKVDDELLEKIVQRIRKAVNPVKIILFGSYAYGNPSKDSDLDILVVVESLESTRRELRLKIRKALREYLVPKGIIVVTKEDIDDWKDVPQAFITSVVRKGRVLYERQDRPG